MSGPKDRDAQGRGALTLLAIWCPGGCNTKIPASQIVCASCRLTLEKYEAENPDVAAAIAKYVLKGLGGFEALLAQHPVRKEKP